MSATSAAQVAAKIRRDNNRALGLCARCQIFSPDHYWCEGCRAARNRRLRTHRPIPKSIRALKPLLCACGCARLASKGRKFIRGHHAKKSHRAQVGSRWGRIIVLSDLGHRPEPSGHRRRWFLVECDCGKIYESLGECITREKEPRCSLCVDAEQRTVNIGDKFDKLVVTAFVGQGSRRMADCACDCGGTAQVRPSCLPTNKTNNCGCDVRGHWEGVGNLSKSRIYRLVRNAKARNLTVSVTAEQLWQLYLDQGGRCALSGVPIALEKRSARFEASVDRIDSSLPYTITNVQWVHKDINKMKMNLPEARFLELCRLVAAHHEPIEKSSAA